MTARSFLRFATLVVVALLLIAAAAAWRMSARSRSQSVPTVKTGEREIFVDSTLSVESCATYAAAERACTEHGSASAFRSLAAAARSATAGTTVVIREGSYRESIVPSASGTADAPITFRPYDEEKVILTGTLDPAIDLSNRQHIVIDRLVAHDVVGWLRAVKTSGSIVRNSVFSEASGTDARGGLTFIGATGNQIRDNVISGGHYNILLIDSTLNVVYGNTVAKGRQALWAILCGSRNIVRRNRLINEWGKAGQVSGCDGVPPEAPRKQTETARNVIEENLFYFTPGARTPAPYAGLEYAGQDGIVRNNIFIGTTGPGLEMALRPGDAPVNRDNRIYHNVFVATGTAGIALPDDASGVFENNVFKNNILYASRVTADEGVAATLEGKIVQLIAGRLTGFVMERNVIYGLAPKQPHVIAVARPSGAPDARALAEWQEAAPEIFRENIDIRPVFRDEREIDFRLADESALVDSGAFLTKTTDAGAGASLRVADARWFSGGLGISGEPGDAIQLEGGSQTARVLAVDDTNGILTLDASLTWNRGQGVSLRYLGSRPGVGLAEGLEPRRSDAQTAGK